jgi:hypothetical protein
MQIVSREHLTNIAAKAVALGDLGLHEAADSICKALDVFIDAAGYTVEEVWAPLSTQGS